MHCGRHAIVGIKEVLSLMTLVHRLQAGQSCSSIDFDAAAGLCQAMAASSQSEAN